jgi:isopentenyl-diphosphate delta-isomerase
LYTGRIKKTETMTEQVILVDQNDTELGAMPKMEAHLLGKLHRAFSIFVFNTGGQLLLQQRAHKKYYSGNKWTNTCCSHPRLGEEITKAAHRRLTEEMGMSCELIHVFNFTYFAEIEEGIYEHEFDHVFFGISDAKPIPNPEEVSLYRYISMEELAQELDRQPENYTKWLKICFRKVMEVYKCNVLLLWVIGYLV